MMFWDNVAWVYDIFAIVINKKADKALCAATEKLISPSDSVLECACGTGLLTGAIAPRCKSLIATDISEKMLKRAKKKFGKHKNVRFEKADISRLPYPDNCFDAVAAANVIHLLDDPLPALSELDRVCKPGGKIVIPTYINRRESGKTNGVSDMIGKAGADFKRAFTFDTYKKFFSDAGYSGSSYILCEGVIPCAVAILKKRQ